MPTLLTAPRCLFFDLSEREPYTWPKHDEHLALDLHWAAVRAAVQLETNLTTV